MSKKTTAMSSKEPLMYTPKRDEIDMRRAWAIRLGAVLLSLVACARIIYTLTGLNPLEVCKGVFDRAVGTRRRTWVTIRDTLVLLYIAIGITPTFKIRFWDIGAEGQALTGGVTPIVMTIYLGNSLPPLALFPLMFLGSTLSVMAWAAIPAFFKAYWNINETLSTLTMNYVAMQVIIYCIIFWENPKESGSAGTTNSSTKGGWLPKLLGLEYGWNLATVLVLTLAIFICLKYNKQGYKIVVVGESESTARHAGINVKRVIIRTMALSDAICSIAGLIIVSGASYTISTSIAGGRGSMAIIVSWFSKFNAFAMVPASFFLVFMQKGVGQTTSQPNLNENASDIIMDIILFFILDCELFIGYKVEIRNKRKEAGAKLSQRDWNMGFLVIFTQKAIGQGIGILYGALGEIMTEKSGNLNLGIPGMMYMGGIAGLTGAFLHENGTDNPNGLVGLLIPFVCVFVCVALGGLVYSVLTITLRANQNMTGLTLITFGVGFGDFFGGSLARLAGGVGQISMAVTGAVYKIPISRLSKFGVIGQTFFSYGFLTYLAVVLALALVFFLAKTRRGLNPKAVDESPATIDATGINTTAYKYLAIYLGGGISGLSGLYFVMGYSGGTWTSNRFGDRGQLAIALVTFALRKPVNAIWSPILFGGLYILYLYIPDLDRGTQEVLKALSYVAIIVVLIITDLRRKREYQPPQSLGFLYLREERQGIDAGYQGGNRYAVQETEKQRTKQINKGEAGK